ncbi:MAG: discoidin domain-containing protein, partial [Polyangiaceae bacterium]
MIGAEAAAQGRTRSSLKWWLFALCLTLLAGCSQKERAAASPDLLFGRSPSAVVGVACAECLTDGTAAIPGDPWESSLSARFASNDSFAVYDLGQVTRITALWLQGDHNDEYRVLLSDDGAVFEQIWSAPRVAQQGLRDRFVRDLDASGRYLRVEPARGDRRFALSELMAFEQAPAVFPPEPPRRRGLPLEVGVRTKLLTLGTTLVLWLLLTSRRTPAWWALALSLLPLWSAYDVISAIAAAWPVEQRQVSLARGVVAVVAACALLREMFAPRRWPAQRAVVL